MQNVFRQLRGYLCSECPLGYCSGVSFHFTLDLVGNPKANMTDKKTSPVSFRFHDTLKKAIDRAAKLAGEKRTEWVAKKLCGVLGLEYVPVSPGRPWPKKKPSKTDIKS